jgi:hypothetical protein
MYERNMRQIQSSNVKTCRSPQTGKHLLNVWLENNREKRKNFNNFVFDSKV